jgi:hypothetical protein
MEPILSAPLFAGALFVGMVVLLEVGRRLGIRRRARAADNSGFGPAESAVFALFGLLIAFTFAGAASRFDSRRMLIADEANAIGTAYLRLDLLAADDQTALQQQFRDYLDSRVEVYRRLPNLPAALAELKRSGDLQNSIWARALPATRQPAAHPSSAMLLMPALNQMFDITTTRTMAARTHPPLIIYYLLFLLALGCALLAGHAMADVKSWSWLHAVGFAGAVAVASYVIVDLEYPRAGFIRVAAYDQVLIDLRESMK